MEKSESRVECTESRMTLKQHVEQEERDEVSIQDSHSSTDSLAIYTVLSTVFLRFRNTPVRVSDREAVSLKGELPYLFLFMAITLMMSSALIVLISSLWAIWWKYCRVGLIGSDDSLFLAAILCATSSILTYGCCWLGCLIHNGTGKNKALLFIMIVGIALIILGLSNGIYFSVNYRTKIVFETMKKVPRFIPEPGNRILLLKDNQFMRVLQQTMKREMENYDLSPDNRRAWDLVQNKSSCCGVLHFKDWLHSRKDIPDSCCRSPDSKYGCPVYEIFPLGCLHVIGTDLAWWASTLTGYSSILLIFMVGTFVLMIYMYINVRSFNSGSQGNLSLSPSPTHLISGDQSLSNKSSTTQHSTG